jgi:hypothetical protein
VKDPGQLSEMPERKRRHRLLLESVKVSRSGEAAIGKISLDPDANTSFGKLLSERNLYVWPKPKPRQYP